VDRRAFLVTVALAVGAPRAAKAQPAGRVHRVGFVATVSPVSSMVGSDAAATNRAFLEALRALGYVEGQNLVVERRSAEGREERYGDILREVVRLKCDVVVTVGNLMALEAKRVTTTVPIVMATSADPVGAGLVASLARPGGNVTGLTLDVGSQLEAKRLELLKEAAPTITRVAYLGLKRLWEAPSGQEVRAVALRLGVRLVHAEQAPNDYAPAFSVIIRERLDGILVGNDPHHWAHRQQIVEFARRNRLPVIGYPREFAEAGALLSYGADVIDQFRRAAGYVDRILKGARPGDLPIEQPSKFELLVNLGTAKVLGLTIPPSVLARADEVIQ
jgi:ABC-type uncharacterized transport system substrate-binding protein